MSDPIKPWLAQEIDRLLAARFANPGPRVVPLKQAVSAMTGIPEEAIGEVRRAGKDADGRQMVEAEIRVEPFEQITSGIDNLDDGPTCEHSPDFGFVT